MIVESAEIQTDLLLAKALIKSTKQKIVPMRVLNLSGHEKVISKTSEVAQCAPVEVVINSEQLPEPIEMLPKDQQKFRISVEKWVAALTAPERNKERKLLLYYACASTMSSKSQGRTGMVKHAIAIKELVEELKRSGESSSSS